MVDYRFEDGRKLQKLENQINAIYGEISQRWKNDPAMKERLRVILDGAFGSYLALALKYDIDSIEIQNTTITYSQAMDDKHVPFSLIR
jgi:hypothetical protein